MFKQSNNTFIYENMKEAKIKLNNYDLAYFDSDPKGSHRPTILMLHGNSNNKDMFAPLFKKFANDFRCIAIDLLGHGQSSASSDYSYTAQAAAIAEFIEKLKLDNVTLIGFSLGGHIGYELLDNNALSSVITLGAPPIAKVMHEGNTIYNFPEWFAFAGDNDTEHQMPKFNIMELMQKSEFTEDEAKFWIEGAGITSDILEYQSQLQAALTTDKEARPGLFNACMAANGGDHNDLIRNTNKPVCLIVGEHDHIDADKIKIFAEKAGDHVSHSVIKDGAHYALYGKSKQAFIQAVDEVIKSQRQMNDTLTKKII